MTAIVHKSISLHDGSVVSAACCNGLALVLIRWHGVDGTKTINYEPVHEASGRLLSQRSPISREAGYLLLQRLSDLDWSGEISEKVYREAFERVRAFRSDASATEIIQAAQEHHRQQMIAIRTSRQTELDVMLGLIDQNSDEWHGLAFESGALQIEQEGLQASKGEVMNAEYCWGCFSSEDYSVGWKCGHYSVLNSRVEASLVMA